MNQKNSFLDQILLNGKSSLDNESHNSLFGYSYTFLNFVKNLHIKYINNKRTYHFKAPKRAGMVARCNTKISSRSNPY